MCRGALGLLLGLGALAFVDLLREIDEALEVLKLNAYVISLVVMPYGVAEFFNGLKHFNKLGKFPQVYESHIVFPMLKYQLLYRWKALALNVRRIGQLGQDGRGLREIRLSD